MAQSLSKIYLHIIFSTKYRKHLIKPEIENELYKFIAGIMRNLDCTAIKIGGITNHIHILNKLSRTITVSKIIENIKRDSSKWIKTKGRQFSKFSWQNGYGVFSVSQSKIDIVTKYIENQKEHHKKKLFKEEYRNFLKEYNVDYDECYVWD